MAQTKSRTEIINELESQINAYGLTPEELLVVLSSILIDFGAGLEDINSPLDTSLLKKLEQEYYANPTLGKALILQGSLMLSWNDKTPT
jgi:hypothetical protein